MNIEEKNKFTLDEYNLVIEDIFDNELEFLNLRPITYALVNKVLMINNINKSNISIYNQKRTSLYSAIHDKGIIKINLSKLKGGYFLEIENQKYEIYIE